MASEKAPKVEASISLGVLPTRDKVCWLGKRLGAIGSEVLDGKLQRYHGVIARAAVRNGDGKRDHLVSAIGIARVVTAGR